MDTDNYLVSLSRQRAIRLMLATLCCLVFATLTQAEDFTVPGRSGSNWVNTGLDIAPGTLLQMSATGQVFVGGRWGLQAPEGTSDCGPGEGFPGGRHRCYGLIVRVTQSRTDYNDMLREQWAYGDSPQHCAEQGGHLWLTVNDDYVGDNDRAFMVHLTQVSCPVRFRVTINGFKVLHQTLDDALQRDGRGDEVFFATQSRLSDSGSSPVRLSRVMGDTNGHTGRVAAGSARPTVFSPGIPGGLLTNDNFPNDPSALSGRATGDPIPFLIFEGPLTPSQVLVVIPTIWEQDQGGPDDLLTAIGRVFNPVLDLTGGFRSVAPGRVPEHPGLLGRILATAPRTEPELGSGVDVKRGIFGDPHNRPIGMARENDLYSFSPQRLRFTFADANEASRTNFGGYGPGVIPITYKDASALEGHYLIFVQIQRL